MEEKILEMKKNKVLEIVPVACKTWSLPIPKVNFEGCPYESSNQLAHYHPSTNVVCISELQLDHLNFDGLEEVITHEIAHIAEASHDPRFHQIHQDIKVKSWKPPSGTFVISDNKKTPHVRERKSDKNRCNYHLCRKKTELFKCLYCGGHYCKEHASPCAPQFFNPSETGKKEVSAHPCLPYLYSLEENGEIPRESSAPTSSKKPEQEGYQREPESIDQKCARCQKKLGWMPHRCKFCGFSYCLKHRLPEDHLCQGLHDYQAHSSGRVIYEKNEDEWPEPKRIYSGLTRVQKENLLKSLQEDMKRIEELPPSIATVQSPYVPPTPIQKPERTDQSTLEWGRYQQYLIYLAIFLLGFFFFALLIYLSSK